MKSSNDVWPQSQDQASLFLSGCKRGLRILMSLSKVSALLKILILCGRDGRCPKTSRKWPIAFLNRVIIERCVLTTEMGRVAQAYSMDTRPRLKSRSLQCLLECEAPSARDKFSYSASLTHIFAVGVTIGSSHMEGNDNHKRIANEIFREAVAPLWYRYNVAEAIHTRKRSEAVALVL